MCSPMVIAGIALSGASAVANGIAASSATKARTAALSAERTRQSGLDREAEALNTQSRERYADFEGQQDAKAADLTSFFQGQAPTQDAVNASAALPRSESGLVVQQENKDRAEARAFTDEQGAKLGQLRSFGDLLGDIGRGQARDAATVGQIGGFKRGSSTILPYELEAASQKGAGARMLGDVLGGLGSIATNAGISGGGSSLFGGAKVATGADAWAGLRTLGSPYGGR